MLENVTWVLELGRILWNDLSNGTKENKKRMEKFT